MRKFLVLLVVMAAGSVFGANLQLDGDLDVTITSGSVSYCIDHIYNTNDTDSDGTEIVVVASSTPYIEGTLQGFFLLTDEVGGIDANASLVNVCHDSKPTTAPLAAGTYYLVLGAAEWEGNNYVLKDTYSFGAFTVDAAPYTRTFAGEAVAVMPPADPPAHTSSGGGGGSGCFIQSAFRAW